MSKLRAVAEYARNLRNPEPEWRVQAAAWGLVLTIAVLGGLFGAFLTLSSVFGGGALRYEAQGSPGPVVFRHFNHLWFNRGKYKDCKVCHDKLFAQSKGETPVFRLLQDSPAKKFRIGKETTTLFVAFGERPEENDVAPYEVMRGCLACATGECHNGKESFSRLECLKCHRAR
jgi:hypothetical protein